MHSRTSRAYRLLPALLLIAAASGCLERQGRPVSPCTYSSVGRTIQVESVDKVDMLFMVDNSNSMAEEQASLTANFPTMVNILTTGDFNQNGVTTDAVDFMPVRDLNLAVVDCNMGTGGYTVPTCTPSSFGDDGLFRHAGNTAVGGCDANYPNFLNFGGNNAGSVAGETPANFAHRFACIATLGTGGCGFEAQLEAPLKALMPTQAQSWTAPGFQPLTFMAAVAGGTPTYGHGDQENAGFERDNAVLAIVVITDEEDGSEQDPEIYNTNSNVYTGDLNLRQYIYDAPRTPVDRYVNGFLSLRRSPGLLVYSAITGIPLDLAPTDPAQTPNYDAILNDSRMTIMVDPAHPNMVVPSCNTPGRGLAYPPRRVVEVAQGLDHAGAGATVQSICQADYSNALAAIIRKIANALSQACLPRALNTNADGSVDCDVVGVMPAGMDCSALPQGCADASQCGTASCGACPSLDRNGDPLIENGRSVCTISQLVPTNRSPGAPAPTGTGWYYDNFTSEGMANCGMAAASWQRIAFTSQPPTGTDVRLECLQNIIAGQGSATATVGTFCNPSDATNATCMTGRVPVGCNPSDPACTTLTCDPVARSCGVSCMTNADCRGAGLVGYVCDTRPKNEVDPVHFPNDTSVYNYCVNPTC